MVMVSHAAYPEVTHDRTPASLSRSWIADILRKRIGYRNLVVSDDLEMGGVLSAAPVGEAAVEHIRAGGDLCLICHREDYIMQAHEALVKTAERDPEIRRPGGRIRSKSPCLQEQVGEHFSQDGKSSWRNCRKAFAEAVGIRRARPVGDFIPRRKCFLEKTAAAECAPGAAMTKQNMIVAGVMSGTSADGINVALVRMKDSRGSHVPASQPHAKFELLGHAEYSYPKKVRLAVLAAMNATQASVADLARLNFLLGELYSDAVLATERQFRTKASLVGCHGQTLYHQGEAAPFLGRKVAVTWQTGEAAIIAARVGTPVVSDFRPADMAAGGKGAPLVPFLDYVLFRDAHLGRIVQNIGGIANLTAIPAGAAADEVAAFDTGPGNMVIDAVTQHLFRQPFDRGGRIAASGKAQEEVIGKILQRGFFRKVPPKTAGREEFGREFVREFLQSCGRIPKRDIVATATALTAESIADAVQRCVTKNSTPRAGISRNDSFRWRRAKFHPGSHVNQRTRSARTRLAIFRRIWFAVSREGGGCIRVART